MSDNHRELGNQINADEPFIIAPLPDFIRFRQLYSDGARMPPSQDGVDILPRKTGTSVVYEPNTVTGFRVKRNVIIVGDDYLGSSDVIMAAVLRHENSHAVFSHLSQADQTRLVDLIFDITIGINWNRSTD
ncbi:hypothetical protein M1271_02235 [Patescibacteria group bacterium]|nr:hypothetical protein [Patescibacteria group bacterium]